MDYIKIETDSPIPKYKQVINSFHEALENNRLKKDEKIPSINQISQKFQLSRDTVLTAFNDLQARGIIISRPGKGYYITKSDVTRQHKIFLLFDKFTAYKEELYASFKDQLKRKASVEIFFHNFNTKAFETLIRESIGNYTAYVIMPIPTKSVSGIIEMIPRDKLYILDRGRRIYGQDYPSVCQSFKKDIYNALSTGAELLKKYSKLILLFPEDSHAPMDLKRGFVQFCTEYNIDHIVTSHQPAGVNKDEAYIVLDDKTLVTLVQNAQAKKLKLGKDVGIISYNDTPLKSIVANGITTISTDFDAMGRSIADLVINKRKGHLENPCNLIIRNSL
ncbi:transcriptional regulator [Mucilaginibacter hurinus]|uniref:Transcriptional regulator n=1 Tax=Mucilaginibacter hurinus TaxID=2201324 RepID=A0A367GMJ4_9SPHI|nr:substrate-binding domain-containing protein [Mucilaginibacter hurinus]RCH54255.1 transcriptional regulator [Mucilaginibacter hurinus]